MLHMTPRVCFGRDGLLYEAHRIPAFRVRARADPPDLRLLERRRREDVEQVQLRLILLRQRLRVPERQLGVGREIVRDQYAPEGDQAG